MTAIAVVGAGPGLGMAIAREFGGHGFDVALIARNAERLEGYVRELAADGVTAEGFPADVTDHDALRGALQAADRRFSGIDVLEYSPVDFAASQPVAPSAVTAAEIDSELRVQLFGALVAAQEVLPGMRERRSGTLLFTTGAGSVDPSPAFPAANSAGAALRNWVRNLHAELDGTGVYAAHVPIAVAIDSVIPGYPTASSSDIAAHFWRLHTERVAPEGMFTA